MKVVLYRHLVFLIMIVPTFLYYIFCYRLFIGWDNSYTIAVDYFIAFILFISLVVSLPSFSKFIRLFFDMEQPSNQQNKKIKNAYREITKRFEKKYDRFLDVNFYVKSDAEINAFAFGRYHVCLNKGLLETIHEDELKAVIAHEIAHLNNGDSVFQFFFVILDGFLSIIRGLGLIPWGFIKSGHIIFIVLGIVTLPITLISLIAIGFSKLAHVMLESLQQEIERKADEFTCNLGYADGLVRFLERIDKMEYHSKDGFLSSYRKSHPSPQHRIDNISRLRRAKKIS